MINKFQQGGSADNEQLLQIVKAYIALKTGIQDENQLMATIQQLQEEGKLEQVAKEAVTWALQQQLTAIAKHGAKLNYINYLNGKTPSKRLGGKCIDCEQNNKFKRDDSKRLMPKNKCGNKFKKNK